jgi:signal recognition particle receptor subunit beta
MSSPLISRKLDTKQLSYTPTARVVGKAGAGKTTLVKKLSKTRHQANVKESRVQKEQNIHFVVCDKDTFNLIDTLGIDISLRPKIRADSVEEDNIKGDVSATFFVIKYDSRFERMIDVYFELETSLISNARRIVVMISHSDQSKTPEVDFKEICAVFDEECPHLTNIIFYSEQDVDVELAKLMYNCISNMNEEEQICHVNKDEVKYSRNYSPKHCQETENELVNHCSESIRDITFESGDNRHHVHLMVNNDFDNDKGERRADKHEKHTCDKYESDSHFHILSVRQENGRSSEESSGKISQLIFTDSFTRDFDLSMSAKKTCITPLRQLPEGATKKIIKNQEVPTPSMQLNTRNQTTEVTDQFSDVARYITRDHSSGKKIKSRLSRASASFSLLRSIIWCRKIISIPAKLRLFRACVLPVLLYGSEVWSITVAQERRLNIFYLKCLRAIVGANLSYRMSNDKLLRLTGEPHLNDILRRNQLRWFGHVNRMNSIHNEPSIMRKATFSYFPNCKRPQNASVLKRWQNKILTNFDQCQIRNCRRKTPDRNRWRDTTINKNVQVKPPSVDITKIVEQVKQGTLDRRATDKGGPLRKVTQVLARTANKKYNCPKCNKPYRPQGITNHVRSCAMKWCKKNAIHMR